MKVAEGYCWAITQAACGHAAADQVSVCWTALYIRMQLSTRSGCSIPTTAKKTANKYSTYQLHCPTNRALTTYTAQKIQHLPPTLPTKTALTKYTARQIQHLPITLPDKYGT
jgi:hypothetical protein